MKLAAATIQGPEGTQQISGRTTDPHSLILQEDGWLRVEWYGGLPALIPPHRIYSVVVEVCDA